MSTENKNEMVEVMNEDLINTDDIYKGRYQNVITKYLGKVIRPTPGEYFANNYDRSTDACVEFLITGFDQNGFEEIGYIIGHTVKIINIPDGCKWEVPEDKTEDEKILFSNIYKSHIIEGHEREIKIHWDLFADDSIEDCYYKRCVPFGADTDGFSFSYALDKYVRYAGDASLDRIMVDSKGEIYYKISPLNFYEMRLRYDELQYYMQYGVNGDMISSICFECSIEERLIEMQKIAMSKLEEAIKSRGYDRVTTRVRSIRSMSYYSNIFPKSDDCFDSIFAFDMSYAYGDYIFYSFPAMFIGQLHGTKGKIIIFEKYTGNTTDIDVDITSKYIKTTPYVDGKERLSDECIEELEW